MKSLGVALALLGIASSGGCASEVGSTTTPEQWIRYAHESIERNRAVQQFVIFAAPLERKVEATLKRDPRITTARFGFEDRNAYYLQGDLVFGEQGGLGYDLVLV